MTKVFSALSVSVDGYISGRRPEGADETGSGLGDAGTLFDWYFTGDTPSTVFDGFKLAAPSAKVFDSLASRVGATVVGHATYTHSSHFAGGGPHPSAPLFVVSHQKVPELSGTQTWAATVQEAVESARAAAGEKDVALMGGVLVTEAIKAGLVDEVILHQVPLLLGGGRAFFRELPEQVRLRLVDAVPAPGVTHLHYEILR
ncbi:dihydrofolate reductase family protein [Amycolatopsis benzoatilytica]|uniref:dihydrofolate reductase family protein n=1 Tax=Amycolatopsis benzoatilytica TaxID=346045 RepID=UPI00037426C3|nr:dihydrofolate reductase family protein [Amycolatopsis benzoatilytica]